MTKPVRTVVKAAAKTSPTTEGREYAKFKKIDGTHPLQQAAPASVVKYKARRRHGGKVVFFNFDLAEQMGLVKHGHAPELNAALEKEILETFSLVIINEYDQLHKVEFDPKDILPGEYMPTRYLQLQHPRDIDVSCRHLLDSPC